MGFDDAPRVGKSFGKYQIVSLIGKGGMGEVYEARDTEKGRTVALKILVDQYSKDDSYRRRFTREAHAAAQLQEPHVVPIHDWGEIDGSLFIDMRLVRGTDLRRLLLDGPFEPARAVAILVQVAAALDAAHTEGLTHRDVKPENIVVTGDDFAYLVDFGIAERHGDARLTQTGLTVGSMAYIAPERLTDQPTTSSADIYSLACVLYETLTGQAPFGKSNTGQLLTAHLNDPPPRPSVTQAGVPAGFDDVVSRGMAKNASDRYGSAGELARAAARALSSPTAPVNYPDATLQAPQMTMPAQQVMPLSNAHTQYAPTGPTAPPTQYAPTGPVAPPTQYAATGPVTSPTQPTYWQGPSTQPPHYPPSGPLPAQQKSSWVVPVVIAVCAAVLLGVVGVTLVLLNSGDSDQGNPSASGRSSESEAAPNDESDDPSTTERETSSVPTTSTTTTTTTTRALVPPPIVRGTDANNQSCDDGIAYGTATGPGTRGARGSDATTCLFVRNVLYAYWESGAPTSAPRTVQALGSVDCRDTGGRCSGEYFIMDCATMGSDDWITCTGGNNARVYIY